MRRHWLQNWPRPRSRTASRLEAGRHSVLLAKACAPSQNHWRANPTTSRSRRKPYPCALAKIHLRFHAWCHLHPHKRHRLGLEQLPHEALHGVITTSKRVVTNQILIDPLGRQPRLHRRRDDCLQGQTQTWPASGQTPGERNGWFCRRVGAEPVSTLAVLNRPAANGVPPSRGGCPVRAQSAGGTSYAVLFRFPSFKPIPVAQPAMLVLTKSGKHSGKSSKRKR